MARMKPQKIVSRKRQSAPATCTRMLGNWLMGYHCAREMQLVVTPNPIGGLPFEQLIVSRCHAGHIATSHGVVEETAYPETQGL